MNRAKALPTVAFTPTHRLQRSCTTVPLNFRAFHTIPVVRQGDSLAKPQPLFLV
jgi:hypothetical protein